MFDMYCLSYAELESKIKPTQVIECYENEKYSELIQELYEMQLIFAIMDEKLKDIEKTNTLALKAYAVMRENFLSISERLHLHEIRIQNLEVGSILPWQRS